MTELIEDVDMGTSTGKHTTDPLQDPTVTRTDVGNIGDDGGRLCQDNSSGGKNSKSSYYVWVSVENPMHEAGGLITL